VSRTVSEISDAFVDAFAALDPVRAARSMGVARDSDRLSDYSPDGTAAMLGLVGSTLDELAAATPGDERERLGAGYLEDVCRGEESLLQGGERARLVSTIVGPPASVRMSFDLMPRETPEDWERVARRLTAVPAAMGGYRVSLTESLDRGRPPTERLVVAAAEQCTTWAGNGDGGWFGAFVASYGDGSHRPALDAAAGAAAAAYGELAQWFLDECAPRAATDDGVGEERYRVWARALLGADLDVAEAYEWGTAELARLEAEKDAECERILPGAGFDAVRDHLDRAPEHGVEGVDAYRSGLQELVDEAIEALAGTEFDVPAGLRTCPVAIPPEGSASAPYYTPPTEDLSQPGQVWFPTMGRQRFTMWNEATTAYHEAVPGHHLQIGTTRLVPLTRAHKLGFNPAHGEGWALYAERLMDELGWFRTPETRLGFLCMQAMRAARVVIDIGLHTGREVPAGLPGASGPWTYELAVAAIGRAGALPEADARSEILRYLSWPSQATAYKLGERSWLVGRAAAMAAAGSSFDRQRWHGRALALGALGLDRLEDELATLA
jgi:uncharacterized protein (DUF885 family)